jgi:DNA modification methylase
MKEKEKIKIDEIRPNPRNPRKIKEDRLNALRKSLKDFPYMMELRPIVIDDEGVILGGNMRWRALKENGEKEIPSSWVKKASQLTEDEKKRFVVMDNEEFGSTDYKILSEDFDLPELEDWGFQLPDEIDWPGVEEVEEADAEPQIDRAEELRAEWKTEVGQLWELGEHRLLCGDSTKAEDVERCLDGAKPLLMVTDPPYGVEYDPSWRSEAGVNKNKDKMGKVANDDVADWSPAWKLFEGDAAYVYHAGVMSSTVQASLELCGFKIRAQIIWAKDRMALSRGDYHWQHEPCWYAVREGKPGHRTDDRKQTTLWEIPSRDDSGHGHGTQKPVECMARPIRNHESEYVYEPFSGSGTTIIACEQLGRKCRAIEISPAYVAVALQRWADATGKTPVLLNKQ